MKTFKEALSLFQLQTGKTFARSRDCKSIRANLYVLRTCFPTIDPHNEPTLGNHYSDSSLSSLWPFASFHYCFINIFSTLPPGSIRDSETYWTFFEMVCSFARHLDGIFFLLVLQLLVDCRVLRHEDGYMERRVNNFYNASAGNPEFAELRFLTSCLSSSRFPQPQLTTILFLVLKLR